MAIRFLACAHHQREESIKTVSRTMIAVMRGAKRSMILLCLAPFREAQITAVRHTIDDSDMIPLVVYEYIGLFS